MKSKDRHLNLDWTTVRYRTVALFLVAALGVTAASWMVWSYYKGRYSPSALASREIQVAERLYQETLNYDQEEGLKSVQDSAAAYLADAHRLFREEKFDESRMKAFLSHNNSQK
ncbi:MAG: hypothetical protein ACE5ID_04825, partial [Acidobacteriota bacterium]